MRTGPTSRFAWGSPRSRWGIPWRFILRRTSMPVRSGERTTSSRSKIRRNEKPLETGGEPAYNNGRAGELFPGVQKNIELLGPYINRTGQGEANEEELRASRNPSYGEA